MLRKLRCLFSVALLLIAAGVSSSQDMRYGYDELGRLIEAVDATSRVTRYAYDPAGNLLRVTVDGELIAPVIDGEIIDQFRCGAPVEFRISGTGLESAQVTASDPHLSISGVQYQDDILSFTLLADCAAPPGSYQLSLVTPSGTLVLDVSVDPSLPGVMVTPVPLAIPPDNSERAFIVRLTNSDTVDHAFTLSVSDPTIAQVTITSLVIVAGEMQVTGGLRGLAPGHTVLHLESGTLGSWQLPVFVTADFAGINTSVGRPVGVQREVYPEASPPFETFADGVHVGLIKGRFLSHLSPSAVAIGSEDVSLEIHGAGFDPYGSVSIETDEGLFPGEPTFDTNGERISLTLSVSPDAPTTVRRVVVRDAEGTSIPASDPHADRLRVVAQAPELHSVSPMNVVPGDSGLTLTLRGANLSEIIAIQVVPPEGITLGDAPGINEDGTVVQTGLTVSPAAPHGPRVITVVTPGGNSGNTPSPYNTLNVAPLIEGQIPVLPSAVVGVLREATHEPGERAVHADATAVGLVLGPVLERLEPAAVPVGGTEVLTLVGAGLGAVDTITVSPDDGIQVHGVPLPGADGASVSIQITVADDAATSLRQVRAFIEGEAVHPAEPDADRLRITPGAPVLHSVSPQNLLNDGEVRMLELRGLRLDHASRLEIIPADHIAVGSLSVSDDGELVRASVDVSPGAEPGPRLVRIHTPGGVTSEAPSPANVVNVVEEIVTSVPSLVGTSVVVVREVEVLPVPPPEYALHAHAVVGLMREAVPESVESAYTHEAFPVGVARGGVATGVSVQALRPGESVSLEIFGFELSSVSQVAFEPDAGITVESTQAQPDGRTVTVSVSVAPEAEPGLRHIRLQHAEGEVMFSNPARAALRIAGHAPRILSIEPILAGQGGVITLLIRGEYLQDAEAVFAEPPVGLRFGNVVSVNADGTELTVPVGVDPDAPLGARVIRLRVPGWETGAMPEPANTFTVYESVP